MQIGMIEGHTRICGKSQGYLGLPLKDIVLENGTPAMLTAWIPTPEELDKIAAGASILVYILGTTPPPMMLEVGEPPE